MDATVGSPDPEDVPTLRDLIQRHIDRTGESRRALGDRSGVAHQTLGYWFAGSIKTFPDPDTIRAFANATGYSAQTVLLAAARTVGLPVDSSPGLAAMLPPASAELSDKQQLAIVGVIEAMVDRPEVTGGQLVDLTRPPQPDLSRVAARRGESEGRRLRDEQDDAPGS